LAPANHALSSPPLSLRHEFVRKALHLVAAAFPVAYSLGVERIVLVWILAGTSTIALLIEGLRRTNSALGTAFERAFGVLTRQHERQSLTGATWLALSCLVAVLVLPRGAAIAALWCATVGDPAAAIVGRALTQNRENSAAVASRKTLAGSLACAAASFVGVWALAGYPPVVAVTIAVTAAAAEALPSRIDDNVRVVGATAVIARLLA
jgi:dolichol kinase